jgi:hypothetical protein
MELDHHGIMSHRKGLKAIPALTAFAISRPLLVRHFSSSDAWEVVAGTPIRCAIPETFSCRLRVAIEGNCHLRHVCGLGNKYRLEKRGVCVERTDLSAVAGK